MKNSIKSSKILMEKNFCFIKGTMTQRKSKGFKNQIEQNTGRGNDDLVIFISSTVVCCPQQSPCLI